MGSTEINIGFNENAKASSRVLKPPGGGHSNIFSPPEVKANPPRPKYNQQNSSNLNAVMGTDDPNIKTPEELHQAQQNEVNNGPSAPVSHTATTKTNSSNQNQSNNSPAETNGGKVRVPPGGFSSGLW